MQNKGGRPHLRVVRGGAPARWVSAERAEQLMLPFLADDVPPSLAAEVRRATRAHQRSRAKWGFWMVSVEDDLRVGRFLRAHARRPAVALMAWMVIKTHIDPKTDELLATREQLAREIGDGVSVRDVSRVLALLVKCNAVQVAESAFDARRRVYRVSSGVLTQHTGVQRDVRQLEFGPLRLCDPAPSDG